MSWVEQYNSAVITIIVPVYNAEAYLKRCIESIKEQTYKEWELILIDDGSTDHSLQICEKLAQTDRRIRVVHMENSGVSVARNRGIEEAKGEYITFVDADDWIHAKFLEVLQENLQPEDDVIGCQFQTCREYRESIDVEYAGQSWTVVDEAWIREILQGNTRCWSKIYRRQYLNGVRFKQGLSIGEDMLFLLELAHKGGRMHNLEFKGYTYFSNPEGAMNRTICASYLDQITCWKYAYERVREDSEEIREMAGKEVLVAAIQVLDKLAVVNFRQRRRNNKYVVECRNVCKAFRMYMSQLSWNHQLKIRLFCFVPGIFWMIDRLHQRKGQG